MHQPLSIDETLKDTLCSHVWQLAKVPTLGCSPSWRPAVAGQEPSMCENSFRSFRKELIIFCLTGSATERRKANWNASSLEMPCLRTSARYMDRHIIATVQLLVLSKHLVQAHVKDHVRRCVLKSRAKAPSVADLLPEALLFPKTCVPACIGL